MAINEDALVKTNDIADAYNISFNHLKKVMLKLTEYGYVKGIKGRNGGFRLAQPKHAINIGAVFRITIEDVTMAECFASPTNACVISPDCRFRHILQTAMANFIKELDNYTLADLVHEKEHALAQHLGIEVHQID